MPGLRGKQFGVDTTTWTEHDWQRARIWNIALLVGWMMFFLWALSSLFSDRNWLLFVPTFVIAFLGSTTQSVWLGRVSHWLQEHRQG